MSETTVKRTRKASAATLAKLQGTVPATATTPAAPVAPVAPVKPKMNAQQTMLAALKVKVVANTAEGRKVCLASIVTPVEKDLKAAAIAKSISTIGNLCSGAKRDVANLMDTVTGLGVRAAYDKIGASIPTALSTYFKPGAILVPLRNPNSHSYEVNKPCIYLGGNQALRMNGTTGNSLCEVFTDSGKTQNVRAATEAEVESVFSFFDCMAVQGFISDDAIKYLKSIK